MEQLALAEQIEAELAPREIVGIDTNDVKRSISGLWRAVLGGTLSSAKSVADWYGAGADYWEDDCVGADTDGVLGGLSYVHPNDVATSLDFLKLLASRHGLQFGRAVDCGAGTGRVTEHVLLPLFRVVDFVEQSPKMVAAARVNLAPWCRSSDEAVGGAVDGATATATAPVTDHAGAAALPDGDDAAAASTATGLLPLPPAAAAPAGGRVGVMVCAGLQGLRFDCLIEDEGDEEGEHEDEGEHTGGVPAADAATGATVTAAAAAKVAGPAATDALLPHAVVVAPVSLPTSLAGAAAPDRVSEPDSDADAAATAAAAAPSGAAASPATPSPPSSRLYDVVWLQWVVGCVVDVDLVALLRSAAACLTPTGMIVVKDNTAREGDAFVYDNEDHSIARSERYLHAVFRRAGLAVLEDLPVPGWEDDLLPVRMYALRRREAPVDVARRRLQAAQAARAAAGSGAS